MSAADRALLTLLWLRLRGGVRARLSELYCLRGALYFCLTVAVLGLLAWRAASGPAPVLPGGWPLDLAELRRQTAVWLPAGLLLGGLLTPLLSAGPALYFSQAEVNFLFAGPFGRRALVLYKLCFYAAGALLSGALIALLMPARFGWWPAAWCGATLCLLFVQLASACVGLGGRWLIGRRAPAVRRLRPVVVALLAAGGGVWVWHGAAPDTPLLAPFAVFANVVLARDAATLLTQAAIAAALLVGLTALLIWLDGHTYEHELAAGQALRRRWQRFKQGGWAELRRQTARSAARPAALAGVGPNLWRQWLAARRGSAKPLLALAVLALPAGALLAEVSRDVGIGLGFFIAVFVLPRSLVFDFRADLGQIETLKTLPLPGWAVCAGQLAVPVLLTSLIELLLLAAAFLNTASWPLALTLAAFLLPFNWLLYAVENGLFLLFPTPLVPVGRVDFDFFGRTLVELAVKSALLGLGCGLAAAAGIAAAPLLGGGWAGVAVVAWLSLTLLGAATLPALAWALRRFDVSRAVL